MPEISLFDFLQKYIDTKLAKHLLDKKKKMWYNNKMQKKGVCMDISEIRQKIDANREKLASFRGSL